MREEVDYFYYLAQGTPEHMERQCADGVRRGYTCFYMKVGVDSRAETEMLAAVRRTIGPDGKIRIDANEAWSLPEAVRLLTEWDGAFGIDLCEAPVQCEPVEAMREIRQRVRVPLAANEGLWGPQDVIRMIQGRGADVLCFSSYWVGSLRRFLTLSHLGALAGMRVVKHTHGELGIAAAAGQHVMLALPNTADGNQQTAAMMQDDVLVDPLPIASGPTWGRIERPGLGVEVDEEKVRHYQGLFRHEGPFLPYRLVAGR